MPFGLQLYRTSVQAQVPGLTPELVDRLRSSFQDEYPSIRPMPIGILIYNEEAGRSLLIGPEQSVVGQEGRPVEPDFAAHQEALTKLAEICEWTEPMRVGFQFVGFIPVGDARTTSLEEFTSVSAATLKSRLPEAFAAALRLLIETDGVRGELRLEPFDPDPRYLVCTAEVGTVEPLALAAVPDQGRKLLDRLSTHWVPFLIETFTESA